MQFSVQKSPIFAVLGSNLNLSNLNKPSADDVFSRCWIYNDYIFYGLRLLAWIISCPNGPKFPIFSGLFSPFLDLPADISAPANEAVTIHGCIMFD